MRFLFSTFIERSIILKKLISIILLCSLLIACLSGCSIVDNGNDGAGVNEPSTEKESYYATLDDFFMKMSTDARVTEKLSFQINYENLHFKLKVTGKYADARWNVPVIHVTVGYNYNLAADEDWYKACANTEIQTLNKAFYNEYKNQLSNVSFFDNTLDMLHFSYEHSEGTLSNALAMFYADYEVYKQMMDLEYVSSVCIMYDYSVPGVIFND